MTKLWQTFHCTSSVPWKPFPVLLSSVSPRSSLPCTFTKEKNYRVLDTFLETSINTVTLCLISNSITPNHIFSLILEIKLQSTHQSCVVSHQGWIIMKRTADSPWVEIRFTCYFSFVCGPPSYLDWGYECHSHVHEDSSTNYAKKLTIVHWHTEGQLTRCRWCPVSQQSSIHMQVTAYPNPPHWNLAKYWRSEASWLTFTGKSPTCTHVPATDGADFLLKENKKDVTMKSHSSFIFVYRNKD